MIDRPHREPSPFFGGETVTVLAPASQIVTRSGSREPYVFSELTGMEVRVFQDHLSPLGNVYVRLPGDHTGYTLAPECLGRDGYTREGEVEIPGHPLIVAGTIGTSGEMMLGLHPVVIDVSALRWERTGMDLYAETPDPQFGSWTIRESENEDDEGLIVLTEPDSPTVTVMLEPGWLWIREKGNKES